MSKLWVFTSRFPFPIEKGDKLRLYYQLIELSQFFEIHLFCLAEDAPKAEDQAELEKYCAKIHVVIEGKWTRWWQTFIAFTDQLPLQVGYFKSPKLRQLIYEEVSVNPPDLIYCHLIRMSEYVKFLPYPKVIDYMDAFSLGMKRAYEKHSNPFWRQVFRIESLLCQRYERQVYSFFDAGTIIAQQDKEALLLEHNDNIKIVKNGIDVEQFYFEKNLTHQKQLLFVGNLGYAPNLKAVQYLVNEIMPLLWERHPEAKLVLAGARPHKWIKQLKHPNIELLGWVENIRDAYARGSVFVAPLFTGSGMQNKILEAMSVGVPCVTTPIVNKSILAEEGEEVLIANTAKEFVNQIELLFENEDRFHQIREKGFTFVSENFQWSISTQVLVNLLKKLESN